MILETVCVGPVQTNCYILAEKKDSPAIIIDPGFEEKRIKKILESYRLKPSFIINTHGHFDHIGGDECFGVDIYIHRKDLELLKEPQLNLSSFFALPHQLNSKKIKVLEDNEIIKLDNISLRVIHVPGHTPGSIALKMESPADKILFTGDTLFCQGIGRTDLPGADEACLLNSIRKRLLVFADDTVIYPGHGPSSTLGREKKFNSFLS
ncbi:MAG: MBL fold metallo-hydrolase [Candidatus Omnitrophica bacterium]|nr:MBL fold metallo-hydrolase [Candidatus Omnitrophota bacterium]